MSTKLFQHECRKRFDMWHLKKEQLSAKLVFVHANMKSSTDLTECNYFTQLFTKHKLPQKLVKGHVVGLMVMYDQQKFSPELLKMEFAIGCQTIMIGDRYLFREPCPFKGKQNLAKMTDELMMHIRKDHAALLWIYQVMQIWPHLRELDMTWSQINGVCLSPEFVYLIFADLKHTESKFGEQVAFWVDSEQRWTNPQQEWCCRFCLELDTWKDKDGNFMKCLCPAKPQEEENDKSIGADGDKSKNKVKEGKLEIDEGEDQEPAQSKQPRGKGRDRNRKVVSDDDE